MKDQDKIKKFSYTFWVSALEDKVLEDAIKTLEGYSNMSVVRSDFFRRAIFFFIEHEIEKIPSPTISHKIFIKKKEGLEE